MSEKLQGVINLTLGSNYPGPYGRGVVARKSTKIDGLRSLPAMVGIAKFPLEKGPV